MMVLSVELGHGEILPASVSIVRTVMAAPPLFRMLESAGRLGSSPVGVVFEALQRDRRWGGRAAGDSHRDHS